MSQENGGSAYPRFELERIYRDERDRSGEVQYVPKDGMSLRDHFAGQALALGGEFFHNIDQCVESVSEHVAVIAYEIADAMLKRREG